jgi:hypothetical protein
MSIQAQFGRAAVEIFLSILGVAILGWFLVEGIKSKVSGGAAQQQLVAPPSPVATPTNVYHSPSVPALQPTYTPPPSPVFQAPPPYLGPEIQRTPGVTFAN